MEPILEISHNNVGYINRTRMTQNKEVMSALNPASFRPRLEYCAHFWAADILEKTQRRVARMEANLYLVTYKVIEGLRLLKRIKKMMQ